MVIRIAMALALLLGTAAGAATVDVHAGRLIDTDEAASMEKKKREGYF